MKKTILAVAVIGLFTSFGQKVAPLAAEEQAISANLPQIARDTSEEQNKIAVLVNNVPITENKLTQAMEPYKNEIAGSETVYQAVRKMVLNELIEDELVLQAAIERMGTWTMVAQEEIDQVIGIIKSRFKDEQGFQLAIKESGLNESDFQTKIKEKLMRIKVSDQIIKSRLQISQEELNKFCQDYGIKVHVQHILVKTEKEAIDILEQAKVSTDFSKLAKEHSLCPSSQVGGDLGFFGRGQMVKEFEDAAFSLEQEGQLSDVVKTQFGYHIIRFIAKEPATQTDIARIKQGLMSELFGISYMVVGEGLNFEIKKNLEERFIGDKLKAGYKQWIIELKANAKISFPTE